MAAGEQPDEHPLEQPGLADDDLAQLEEDALDRLGGLGVVHRRARRDVVAFIDVLWVMVMSWLFAFAVMGPPEIDLTLPIGP